ncbi:polysaccharide lyase family 7 protein [Erythrobacter donghaensis]|uniref:polysaccharide lyase family 7 protein n=1 Tax=Erythrobacter donghaensis TaxID=267135 RepID=UPI000A363FB0|nr:polysaccharide lyase family 7 protein [Erythrobacter donghaensis]
MLAMRGTLRAVALGAGMMLASAAQAGPLACNVATDDPALAPGSQPKFANVLKGSRYLQIDTDGESSGVPACIDKDAMLDGHYVPDNWHLVDRNMHFSFTGGQSSYRVELRGESFAGDQPRQFLSKVKLVRSAKMASSYTIAQVFSETERKPILRVAVIASRKHEGKTYANYVWAIYRFGVGDGQSRFVPLGPASKTFEALDITYNEANQVRVSYGTASATFDQDFGFWSDAGKQVYFKAGCYLQASGDCSVTFSSLKFGG